MGDSQTSDRVRRDLLCEAERAAGIGTWTWKAERGELELSDHALRLVGLSPDTFDSSVPAFMKVVHPDEREWFLRRFAEMAETDSQDAIEFRVVWPDGSIRTLAGRGRAARHEDSSLQYIVGTLTDRTEDIAREDEASRAKMILDLSQRIARVGTFVWDPMTDTAEWSGEMASILGVDEPMTLEAFVRMVHPDDLPVFGSLRETVLEKRIAGPVRIRFRRPSGELRHVICHVVSSADPDLSPQIGVLQDVTERVQLENQLRVSETLESVGRLAAGVAHDFNNLMTVMLTNAQDLSRERPDERLDQIVAAVESGAELVRRLLAVGKHGPTNPKTIDLTQTMRELAKWAPRVLGDDVELRLEFATTPTPVVADPAELHQVVLNLLANARDAMPDGGRLTLRTVDAGAWVRLEVADEGVGMAPEVLEHALDPFFTTKPFGEGTGLGLSITHGVVTGLGGKVSLASPPEGGTTVSIELPRAAAPAETPTRTVKTPDVNASGKLLIVEDDEHVRRVTARILQRAGYAVVAAAGPNEADAQLAEFVPDIVVSDVSMPEGGGRRVAEMLAARHPGVPILFVTGNAPTDELPGPVVHKPFLPDELIGAVAELLSTAS